MLRIANNLDIPVIQELAELTWWQAYCDILSVEQLTFMLEKIYNRAALKEQMEHGAVFFIISHAGKDAGFASVAKHSEDGKIFKLHKLYLNENVQGKGLGKALLQAVETYSKEQGALTLELNVNRYNPTLAFYQKQGFSIQREDDIPFYQFYMNDYIMQKGL